MPLVAPAAEWERLSNRLRGAVPEAFDLAARALNLLDSEWKNPGFGRHDTSAIDGRSLGRIPMLDLDSALAAVKFARSEANTWARVDLDERRRRATDCLAGLKQHRELRAKCSSATSPTTPNSPKKPCPRLSPPTANLLSPLRCLEV